MDFKIGNISVRRGKSTDEWLVDEAKNDRWIGGVAESIRHLHELYIFVVEGKAIGFVIPLRDPDGSWQTGTIYITPEQRTFGSVKKMMAEFFQRKKSLNFGVELEKRAA